MKLKVEPSQHKPLVLAGIGFALALVAVGTTLTGLLTSNITLSAVGGVVALVGLGFNVYGLRTLVRQW